MQCLPCTVIQNCREWPLYIPNMDDSICILYLTTDQAKTVAGFKNKTGILSAIFKQQTRWFKYFDMKAIWNDFFLNTSMNVSMDKVFVNMHSH